MPVSEIIGGHEKASSIFAASRRFGPAVPFSPREVQLSAFRHDAEWGSQGLGNASKIDILSKRGTSPPFRWPVLAAQLQHKSQIFRYFCRFF
jgi:hypothetical protein